LESGQLPDMRAYLTGQIFITLPTNGCEDIMEYILHFADFHWD
jgi:hypothetical protein